MRIHRHLIPLLLLVAAGCVVAGCHSSSSGSDGPPIGQSALRTEGLRTNGGEGDGLAAALLLAAEIPPTRPGRATMQMTDLALRDRLAGKRVGLIVCGSNIDIATLHRQLDQGAA